MPLLFMSFSPDGQILISGGLDNQVKWWNVQTGQGFVRNLTTVGFGGLTVAQMGKQRAVADQTIRPGSLHGKADQNIARSRYGVRVVLFTSDRRTLISSDESHHEAVGSPHGAMPQNLARYMTASRIAFSSMVKTWSVVGKNKQQSYGMCKPDDLKLLKGHGVWVRSVALAQMIKRSLVWIV